MILFGQHSQQFLAVVLLLSLVAFSVQAAGDAGQNQQQTHPIPIADPGSELWRDVRARDGAPVARTQSRTVDAEVLIRSGGEEWRQFRMGQLIPYAGITILVVFSVIVLFRLLRGQIKIQAGRSGKTITRFSKLQRYVHWITAGLFVLLGLTGMVLMFGRSTLLPILGPDVFGAVANVSKILHDYAGPVFSVSLLLLIILFFKGNLPKLVDFSWFLKGGGLFGSHVSAGRYNGGEKAWYWLIVTGGSLVVVSGLVLDFPIFGQTRETMETYHMLHAVAAAVLIAVSFGHIYMGTFAMEGVTEAMVTGEVDENWAREHHDLWYEEVAGKAKALK